LISHQVLVTWLIAMSCSLLYRFIIYISFRKHYNQTNIHQYATYFVIGSGITGLLWGAAGIVLFPESSIPHQFLIVVILLGLSAGSLNSHHKYLPAFYTFFLLALIPVTINLFIQNNSIMFVLGITLIIYIVFSVYYGDVLHKSYIKTLRLQFENIELAEQLQKQKEQAEHANMAKSKFLAAASHDLRQPLHALTLFTSTLNASSQTPKNKKIINQIDDSVHALENLFNALLDISKLDAGTMQPDVLDFNIQPIFARLKNNFEIQAKDKSLDIAFPDTNVTLRSDPSLLEQILRNFISNALHYTEHGEIRIECAPANDTVLINIIDTGIGIPKEQQQKIFEEFHQLNNPERDRNKGLGLGLSIVKRTADLLGHPIEVESEPGKGTTFTISVAKGDPDAVTHHVALKVDDTDIPAFTGVFVVIDDENRILEGMENLFQTWGHEVITATDQEQALNKLQQAKQKPDGIIADYRLRLNRTGIEAIHAIQAQYGADIPALIITGDIAVEQLLEVNKSGIQVLHKPVAPVKLSTFIRNSLLQKKTNHNSQTPFDN